MVNKQIYRDVAGVRGYFIAQEIARNNTGKLDINRSATSRTISLVILVCMLYFFVVYAHKTNTSANIQGFGYSYSFNGVSCKLQSMNITQ